MNITRWCSLTALTPVMACVQDTDSFRSLEPAKGPEPIIKAEALSEMSQPPAQPKIKEKNFSQSEKVYDHEGVTLLTHQRENSPFFEYEGCIQTPGKLNEAQNLLTKPGNIQRWLDGLEHIQVTETAQKDRFTLHASTRGFGPIISPHEVKLDCHMTQNRQKRSVTLTMNRIEPKADDKPSGIYAKEFEGKLAITQTDKDQLRLDFSCFMDPGGSLSGWGWVVNKASTGSVIKSLNNMRRLLQSQQPKNGEPM